MAQGWMLAVGWWSFYCVVGIGTSKIPVILATKSFTAQAVGVTSGTTSATTKKIEPPSLSSISSSIYQSDTDDDDDDLSNVFFAEAGSSEEELFQRMVFTETVATADTSTSVPEFCHGMYMTMFMDGFHWSILFRRLSSSPHCLNYFVRSWKLENASQFRGAMIFTFLLAILVEALSSARTFVLSYFSSKSNLESSAPRRQNQSVERNHGRQQRNRLQHVLLTGIYGLQAILGYALMIITMSFSVELLLSVVAGLMMGNLLFIRYESSSSRNRASGRSSNNPRNATTPESNQTNRRNESIYSNRPEVRPLLSSGSSGGTMGSTNLRRRV
jgi:hypothetical protein